MKGNRLNGSVKKGEGGEEEEGRKKGGRGKKVRGKEEGFRRRRRGKKRGSHPPVLLCDSPIHSIIHIPPHRLFMHLFIHSFP